MLPSNRDLIVNDGFGGGPVARSGQSLAGGGLGTPKQTKPATTKTPAKPRTTTDGISFDPREGLVITNNERLLPGPQGPQGPAPLQQEIAKAVAQEQAHKQQTKTSGSNTPSQPKAPNVANIAIPKATTPTAVPKPTVTQVAADPTSASIANDLQAAIDRIVYPDRPTMRSGQEMADHLGIIYDRQYFEDTMRNAAEKKYANLDAEFGRTQDMFYDSAANSANLLMGALRRGDRDAVMTGTARGSQQAQELSAMLGVSQDHSQGATELAHHRSDLVHQREAEMAQIVMDALKYYNDVGRDLGQLSASELGHQAVMHSGETASMAGLEAALRGIRSQDANHLTGLQNNLDVSNIQAQAQMQAAQAQAAAQMQAAQAQAAAQRYSADRSFAGQQLNQNQNQHDTALQFQIGQLQQLINNSKAGSAERLHYEKQLADLLRYDIFTVDQKPSNPRNINWNQPFNTYGD